MNAPEQWLNRQATIKPTYSDLVRLAECLKIEIEQLRHPTRKLAYSFRARRYEVRLQAPGVQSNKRFIAYAVLRMAGCTWASIGELFGRTHATVIHGARTAYRHWPHEVKRTYAAFERRIGHALL